MYHYELASKDGHRLKESVRRALFLSDVCTYKNAVYMQGQQWYDDCDKVCVCEDGSTGYYRCTDRLVNTESVRYDGYKVSAA